MVRWGSPEAAPLRIPNAGRVTAGSSVVSPDVTVLQRIEKRRSVRSVANQSSIEFVRLLNIESTL